MSPKRMLSRRNFLRCAAAIAAGAAASRGKAWAQGEEPSTSPGIGSQVPMPGFIPGHIRYRGGRWQEYPTAMASLLEEVRKRTSIIAGPEAGGGDLSSPELFEFPFLYLSGRYEFEMPKEKEIDRLRRHLTYGGFLLIDDGLGLVNEGFGRTARELVRRLYPREALEPLPTDHAMFKSYYLIRSIGGRQAVSQELEGIHLGRLTPVVFCRNDLAGAWARRPDGGWIEGCSPGGEPQRKAAFHLGVNIVLYAMTGNYKQDLIHHPIIQRRLNQG